MTLGAYRKANSASNPVPEEAQRVPGNSPRTKVDGQRPEVDGQQPLRWPRSEEVFPLNWGEATLSFPG